MKSKTSGKKYSDFQIYLLSLSNLKFDVRIRIALAFLLDCVDECTHTSSNPDAHIIAVLEEDRRFPDKANSLRYIV